MQCFYHKEKHCIEPTICVITNNQIEPKYEQTKLINSHFYEITMFESTNSDATQADIPYGL